MAGGWWPGRASAALRCTQMGSGRRPAALHELVEGPAVGEWERVDADGARRRRDDLVAGGRRLLRAGRAHLLALGLGGRAPERRSQRVPAAPQRTRAAVGALGPSADPAPEDAAQVLLYVAPPAVEEEGARPARRQRIDPVVDR